jgi:hypothetical protein
MFGAAVLTLAIAAPVYAQEQHEQEEKSKPAQEQKKAPEKSAKEGERNAKPEAKAQERSAQPEKNAKPEQKNAQRQDRNNQGQKSAQNEHSAKRGGGRIPDDRYKANFGREHSFRVNRGDYDNHRFQYGGYWFAFAGEWPSNWLYTQDVYVIELNGNYFLCNPRYPGVNVAIDVTL